MRWQTRSQGRRPGIRANDLSNTNELEILGSHGMAAHKYPAMPAQIPPGDITRPIPASRRPHDLAR